MSILSIRSPRRRRSRRAALLLAPVMLALCALSTPAFAETRNEVMAYGGAYNVSDGFDDRFFAGVNVDLTRDDVIYHGEISTVDREESATFASAGASWRAGENLQARVQAGTSTDNENISPDVFLFGGLTFEAAQQSDWALSPSATYRHYNSGDWETTVALEGVRYADLEMDDGGYYVFQLRGALAPNSSDEVGYSVGATVTTVRANGLSLGIGVEAGHAQYDTQQGLSTQSDYVAVRPTIGYRLNKKVEIFARGEFADAEIYEVSGVMVGVKTNF